MAELKVTSPRVTNDLQNRLRRIEGQVRGIQRMLAEERECHEIVQQLNATRSALHSASLLFMREYAAECFVSPEDDDPATREAMLDDLFRLISKV